MNRSCSEVLFTRGVHQLLFVLSSNIKLFCEKHRLIAEKQTKDAITVPAKTVQDLVMFTPSFYYPYFINELPNYELHQQSPYLRPGNAAATLGQSRGYMTPNTAHLLNFVQDQNQIARTGILQNVYARQGYNYGHPSQTISSDYSSCYSPDDRYYEQADLKEKIRSDILKTLSQSESPSPSDQSSYAVSSLEQTQANMNSSKLGKRNRSGSPEAEPKRKRIQGQDGGDAGNHWDIPPQVPLGTGTEKISEAIWQFFLQNQQSEEMYQGKVQLRNALYAVLQGVFPYCGLYIVGSSMNGFGMRTSDMDLCLMLSSKKIDQKREATEILYMIQRALRKCSFVKKCEVIRAKVPILKFWDKIGCVEIDLNINNSVGIRNTHLLRYYATMDWRVRPLMLFIKRWARFHDINDARKMTISSYSLGLMLIHYLQAGCNPPLLPCLQKFFPRTFNPSTDIRVLKLNEQLPVTKMKNKESLGDLFLGFLEYYTFRFDYRKDAISVRVGVKLPKSTVQYQIENPSQWKCLCIEEPFDLSNTARAVYDENTFERIHRVFRTSYLKLRQKKDVSSVLSKPF